MPPTTEGSSNPDNSQSADLETQVLSKVTWRLIPFMFILYIIAYLDRVNVSFADLQMRKSLDFTATIYGRGAGIFFIGYFIFEVPSNLIMERTGARIWIARIMVSWGLLSAGMMFTNSVAVFYTLRFLLGVAEAGFFPGMILYLTYWFPRAERAKAVAWFMTAVPISGVIGSPISGALLKMHGFWGLEGWQWMFLLEGIPAVLLGGVVLYYMTDTPEQANWLTPEEKKCLIERLQQDKTQARHDHLHTLKDGLSNPKVLLLSLLYFCLVVGSYGANLWLPQLIQARGVDDEFQIGLLTALPNLAAAIGMVYIGISSDRRGERRLHIAVAALVTAITVAWSAHTESLLAFLVLMSIASIGMRGTLGPFWALSTSFLGGAASAGGIALINSIGNLGGYAGPDLMGALKTLTNEYVMGLSVLAIMFAFGGLIVMWIRPKPKSADQSITA